MGTTEEIGEVAKGVVSSFGPANAACLASILLAAMFAILTYMAMQRDADRRSALTQAIITRCLVEVGDAAKEKIP